MTSAKTQLSSYWILGVITAILCYGVTVSSIITCFVFSPLVISDALFLILLTFISISKELRPQQYTIIIYLFSLYLILTNSLLSPYPVGYDSKEEFYIAKLTVENGRLAYTFYEHIYATCLSVSSFIPILNIISGIDLVLVFKFLMPVLFALMAPILFISWLKIVSPRWAFFSTAILIIDSTFWNLIPGLLRGSQALLLLTIIVNRIIANKVQNKDSLIVSLLLSGIVLSHYFSGFIITITFMFSLIPLALLWLIAKITNASARPNTFISREYLRIAIISGALLVMWYFYGHQSLAESHLVYIFTNIQLFSRSSPYLSSIRALSSNISFLSYLFYASLNILRLFAYLGAVFSLIRLFARKRKKKEHSHINFVTLSFGVILYQLLGLCLPSVFAATNFDRVYMIGTPIILVFTSSGFQLLFHKKKILSVSPALLTSLLALASLGELGILEPLGVFSGTFRNISPTYYRDYRENVIFPGELASLHYFCIYSENHTLRYYDIYDLLRISYVMGSNFVKMSNIEAVDRPISYTRLSQDRVAEIVSNDILYDNLYSKLYK